MNLNNNEQEIREVQLEEYALKLDAIDFACRSKAKAKPQGREPACSSLRTVPIGKRTWTDGEPGKFSFSDCEVSKKVMYLLRHSQHVYREEDGADQFWRIKENLQKYFLYYPHLASGKHARQEEEETRKDFSIVLILLEQLCISELFKYNVIIQSNFFQCIYHVGCAIIFAFYHQFWINTWRSKFE